VSELDEYKRPWRVEQSPKRKKHGGYNYRIRSANNYYIAEYLSDGDLAQHIVSAVNERDHLRAALAAATAERDHARRHVELLREELDAVPVAALDALADSADAVPAKIIEWLAWATLGAHWQPADQPCPDCGADALAVAVHADGTIEQWLCDECGYVAAPKDQVQP